MLTFKYKTVFSKTNKDLIYIRWECSWDGRHDNDVFADQIDGWPFHPFSDTFEYKEQLAFFDKMMARFKRLKKKEIYLHTPRRSNKKRIAKNQKKGLVDWRDMDWPEKKYSKQDILDLHPDKMREIGDYVAYNPATFALCRLLADKSNIGKHSGNTRDYCYWMKMLSSLCLLWD